MAKKVKFPLDMGNEVYVRTLEELKENYDTEKVTEYFLDGRLLTWLNDRYYEEEAEQVQELMDQGDKNDLAAKLGKIFGVEIESEVDIETLEIRREKLDKLRRITSDDKILENVDLVAFSQEELGDLLDEGAEAIYLCGDKFRIPLSAENMMYIGVNDPVISFGGKGEIDLEASGIIIVECEFSEDTKDRLKVTKTIDKSQPINMKDFSTEEIDGLMCLTAYSGNEKSVEIPNGIEIIGEAAFAECTAKVIIIPNSVVKIADYAFSYCENLENVEIPNSVITIGCSAFLGCEKLEKAEIPNSVVAIGNSAFSGCKKLEKVNISANVETIGNSAFDKCTSLTEINVDSNNKSFRSLNGILFNYDLSDLIRCPCKITGDYTIPDSVVCISDSAFSGCVNLKNIEIPDSVTAIDEAAFWGCVNLKSIKIPEGIETIANHTFENCTNLKSIEIPDGVEEIGECAFSSSGLKSIEIPDSVETIGEGAFFECKSLEEIELPQNLQAIGENAFESCESLRSINIPMKITSIEDSAFAGCKNLESVSLPKGIVNIGSFAFADCECLSNINIPNKTTEIGFEAFANCINITIKYDGRSYKYDKFDKLKEALISKTKGKYF